MAGVPAIVKGLRDDSDDGDAPWHDQTLPLPERMKLAEGKPLRRRMMAAMAQQDCGQCGYNCEDYSNAHRRQEGGAAEPVRAGRQGNRAHAQVALRGAGRGAGAGRRRLPRRAASRTARPRRPAARATIRRPRTFLSRTPAQQARLGERDLALEFDLGDAGIDYTVGDSFGIFPTNDPALVDARHHGARRAAGFPDRRAHLARRAHRRRLARRPRPTCCSSFISYLTGGERRQKAKALAAGEDPDGDAATLDVLAAIEKFPGIRPDPEAFIEALDPLQPRLYSIASSPKVDPGRVALTVDTVRYRIGKRTRLGVASTFLAERIARQRTLKCYVQPAHAFGLPADPQTPIVMIGPGTGVAPFRAFLHERMATKANGRNWLFFGHQRSACDFFYEDEFAGMKARGVLTRLSLAWSRDGEEKFYVQDRMREVGRDLWHGSPTARTSTFAAMRKRMAKDVERALVDIVAQHGARSADQAIAFVAELKKQGRYQQDVY